MKKLTVIMRQGCPYCELARDSIEQAKKKYPFLRKVEVEYIDETETDTLAVYDHYYAPALFIGEKKVSEGESSLKEMKKALTAAHNARDKEQE